MLWKCSKGRAATCWICFPTPPLQTVRNDLEFLQAAGQLISAISRYHGNSTIPIGPSDLVHQRLQIRSRSLKPHGIGMFFCCKPQQPVPCHLWKDMKKWWSPAAAAGPPNHHHEQPGFWAPPSGSNTHGKIKQCANCMNELWEICIKVHGKLL